MITVGFSTTGDWISRAIRWFTGSKYSHTWVRYHHPYFDQLIVVEASMAGVRENAYDRVTENWDDVVELVPPDDRDMTHALAVLGPSLGSPYDFKSIVGRAWAITMGWLGRKVKNPFRNPKRDVCVENALRFVKEVDPRFRDIDPNEENPGSLYLKLVAAGWRPFQAST